MRTSSALAQRAPRPLHTSAAQVMIWDDHQGKCIGELSFKTQVRGLRRPLLDAEAAAASQRGN